MTAPTIIPWVANENTKYSTQDFYADLIQNAPADTLVGYVVYVLWECSTEFMVSHGLPTDADVKQWIIWLEGRPDRHDGDVQHAITACEEYLN